MGNTLLMTMLTCIVTFCTSGLLGFCVGKIKTYKNRDKKQEEALKCLLRSSITSKFYVYSELGCVPRYERENVNYMHKQYKDMNGNSYVDIIMTDFNKLPIKED